MVLLDVLQAGLSELLNGIFFFTQKLACCWAEGLQKGSNVHGAADCSLHPLLSCVFSSFPWASA